ncbi:MAG: phenylalanine--tRNA ligase subunit alpha [Acidobacteriota bacterium]|nr:phenylalanine--tRNA ligase subunit alpha [Acidobacteriota bacterium]
MPDPIADLKTGALREISAASSTEAIEALRVAFLGKKGSITGQLKSLAGIADVEARRRAGEQINTLKAEVTAAIDERRAALLEVEPALASPLDITVPGARLEPGASHPILQMIQDLNDAFRSLNFEVFDGPEISSELYDFDNLNFPPDHPARESMDTYWLAGHEHENAARRLALRPHLTGASVRYMQRHTPPFRFVYPGRVFRNETTDASHERAFFQYEALIVDRKVPFTAGRLLIQTILDTVFGRPVKTRMRAGFFPFVEPGFEIDMACLVCDGAGCRVCKHVGWLEIMPGGVPHPNVLRAGGIDPGEWMGFYVNIGMDRLVMMRYGVDDVRLFHGADLRFLHQFR